MLTDLDASYTDHRRCGVLEADVNEPTVLIAYGLPGQQGPASERG